MARVFSVILVAALAGVLAGAAVAYVEISSSANAVGLPGDTPQQALPLAGESSVPRVQVDEPDYDFGTMEQGRKKSHTFVLKNVGTAPLTLRVGSTSCKCTVGEVTNKPIPPGESGTVTLEWTARSGSGAFRQTANVQTNDPLTSTIELAIHGEVTEAQGVEPTDFNFDAIPVGEARSAQVYVMAMLQDDLTVSSAELSDPMTADAFDVKIEPVEKSELPNPKARAGVRITLTAQPGLPLGRFDQWLALKTNLAEGEDLEIPVTGRVVGDITVHGLEWNEEQAVLLLGRVKSSEGKRAKLNLMVRGSEAEVVKFEVASTDPPELKVTIGEPKKLREGLLHVPLAVEVPVGTRPMIRTETAQGDAGRIVLKTTHPKIDELVLNVRFSVER